MWENDLMKTTDSVIAKIIVSDGSQGGQPGAPTMLIGPTLSLNMPVVPTALSFNVSVLVYGADFSTPRQLKLEISPEGEPNKIVYRLVGKLPALELRRGSMVFNFGVHNAVFEKEGFYKAVATIDGEKIAEDRFITIHTGAENGFESNNKANE